jgi:uncharacterized protein (UPF0332 family)
MSTKPGGSRKRRLSNAHLLELSRSHAKAINQFRLGVQLNTHSGLTIDELLERAARDRFGLAQESLRASKWVLGTSNPRFRVVVARAYYAMYHAARAVVFFIEGGDDHEAHLELPKHLPKDFPERERWENEIKGARYERNRADYDPYPKSDSAFTSAASTTLSAAEEFLR